MERIKIDQNIVELKGYELSLKIKQILLDKFNAKKKFLQTPSIENSALQNMTDYVFDEFMVELKGGYDRQENYKNSFTLNLKYSELVKKVWAIVARINEYEVVSEGSISKYTYTLFKVGEKELKILERRLRAKAKSNTQKMKREDGVFMVKSVSNKDWYRKWEEENNK